MPVGRGVNVGGSAGVGTACEAQAMRSPEVDPHNKRLAIPSHTNSLTPGFRQVSLASTSTGIVAPLHPVPSMRPAFEESIIDADNLGLETGVSLTYKQRSRYHRLRKVVAQIAFGMYLLHGGLAKSDSTVVRILQDHIDDIDQFLSSITTAFESATIEITARLQHLHVPLDHVGGVAQVFDKMLENKHFCGQMVERNEKIDYMVETTAITLRRSMRDLREGLGAVDELAKYLLELRDGWKGNLVSVYAAMTHNTELWFRCCVSLQKKGTKLGERVDQLRAMVREIERRTGVTCRRQRVCHFTLCRCFMDANTVSVNTRRRARLSQYFVACGIGQ
jgi:cell division protein FtsB